MFTPQTSKHFTKHMNENGIEFYVLSTHIAPVQQGFYFINTGYSEDTGRYLYFYCAYPPSTGHTLGVVDFLTDEVYALPDTGSSGASWYIEPKNGNVWFGAPNGIYRRSPEKEARPELIFPWPQYIKDCRITGYGTHITFSPDGKELLTDVQTWEGSFIGTFHLETGEYTEWYRTPYGIPYNHAQYSPVDPDVCMCAHEGFSNPLTGEHHEPYLTEEGIYPRLEIIHRDGTRDMRPPFGNYASHEFWAPDGKSIYYVNNNACYDKTPGDGGTFRHHLIVRDILEENRTEVVCDIPVENGVGCWHSHCTKDQKYFVVDGSYPSYDRIWWRGCPSLVRFWNNETKKLLEICTLNPPVEGWTPDNPSPYHIDPHPRFVLNDTLVCFTTTVCGRVDLALAPVQQLIDATK